MLLRQFHSAQRHSQRSGATQDPSHAVAFLPDRRPLTVLQTRLAGWLSKSPRTSNLRSQQRLFQAPTVSVTQRTKETPLQYMDTGEIDLMELKDFNAYAQKQSDWFAEPEMTEEDRDRLRKTLAFAREPHILDACGSFYVDEVGQLDEEAWQDLRTYSQAVTLRQPFHLEPAGLTEVGVYAGGQLRLLLAHFGVNVLREAMNENAFTAVAGYEENESLTQDVIDYQSTSEPTPYFQAQAGKDFEAYAQMRKTDNKNPLSYNGTLLNGKIRNFHRFLASTLDQAAAHYENTEKKKPVTLVLRSAIDYNGAFIRSQGLDEVVGSPKNLTLLVEGGETLEEYRNWISILAGEYAPGGKLDQILFSGHGGMRSVEMAGSPDKDESLDLDKESGIQFIETVLDHLAPDVHEVLDQEPLNVRRRIVFDACLTNTNYVPWNKLSSEDFAVAAQQVREYITNHPTLTAYVNKRIQERGYKASAEGANAVTRASSLIDVPSGRLGLSSQDDTHLVADKLGYVAFGKEPVGVFRAAVECLANTRPQIVQACLKEMERRSQETGGDWRQTFIQAGFALVLKQDPKNHLWLLSLLSTQSHQVEDVTRYETARVSQLRTLAMLQEKVIPFFEAFQVSSTWKTDCFRLCTLQVWMGIRNESSLREAFLQTVDKKDCGWLSPLIDIACLDKGLMEPLLSGGATNAKLKLALLGVLHEPASPAAKEYLLLLLGQDPVFNPILGIAETLKGLSTPDKIQTRIGKPPPGHEPQPEQELEGNVRPIGKGRNTEFLRSVTKNATVLPAEGAKVYRHPDLGSDVLNTLPQHQLVNVFGESQDWLGIEFRHNLAEPGYLNADLLKNGGKEDTDQTAEKTKVYNTAEKDHVLYVLPEDSEVTILERGETTLQVTPAEAPQRFNAAFIPRNQLELA